MSDFMDGLLYDKENCWVKVDGDIATVGITKPAANKVKEFVFIELPDVGDRIPRFHEFVTLEAMKWSGSLKSPLTGEVVEINDELEDEPGLINEDPYRAWIIKMRMADQSELDGLVDKDAMVELTEE